MDSSNELDVKWQNMMLVTVHIFALWNIASKYSFYRPMIEHLGDQTQAIPKWAVFLGKKTHPALLSKCKEGIFLFEAWDNGSDRVRNVPDEEWRLAEEQGHVQDLTGMGYICEAQNPGQKPPGVPRALGDGAEQTRPSITPQRRS